MNEFNHSSIINFNLERDEKQYRMQSAYEHLRMRLWKYFNREISLQEKVQAKHIFSDISHLSFEQLLLPRWESQFLFWFMCDYVNVKGQKFLERYIAEHKSELDEDELSLSAHWLVSYLSIYEVEKIRDESVCMTEWMTGSKLNLARGEICTREFEGKQCFVLLRAIRVGYENKAAGPVEVLPPQNLSKVFDHLNKEYSKYQQQRKSKPSWRLFMQSRGITVLQYL